MELRSEDILEKINLGDKKKLQNKDKSTETALIKRLNLVSNSY